VVPNDQAIRAIYIGHHAALCAYFARRDRGEVEDLVAETDSSSRRGATPRRIEHCRGCAVIGRYA
jgi:hypothetical protein